MRHNYKRITALAGMTALLVSMPVSVYAGQVKNAYTANLSGVLRSIDTSSLKQNVIVRYHAMIHDITAQIMRRLDALAPIVPTSDTRYASNKMVKSNAEQSQGTEIVLPTKI